MCRSCCTFSTLPEPETEAIRSRIQITVSSGCTAGISKGLTSCKSSVLPKSPSVDCSHVLLTLKEVATPFFLTESGSSTVLLLCQSKLEGQQLFQLTCICTDIHQCVGKAAERLRNNLQSCQGRLNGLAFTCKKKIYSNISFTCTFITRYC